MQYQGNLNVLSALHAGEPVVVIVCGGGMSCVSSLGALVALARAGLHTKPKACIGVSGGACNLAALLSKPGEIEQTIRVYEHLAAGRFLYLRYGLWGPYLAFDQGELMAALAGERSHIDLPSLCPVSMSEQPVPFWAVATHIETGQGVLFDARADLFNSLRASMSLPGVCEPVTINGSRYLDGAIGMQIGPAMRKVMARKVIIITNRPPPGMRGWVEEVFTPAITRIVLASESPKFREAAVNMDAVFDRDLKRLAACARIQTLLLHPEASDSVQPWCSSVSALRASYTSALQYTEGLIAQTQVSAA